MYGIVAHSTPFPKYPKKLYLSTKYTSTIKSKYKAKKVVEYISKLVKCFLEKITAKMEIIIETIASIIIVCLLNIYLPLIFSCNPLFILSRLSCKVNDSYLSLLLLHLINLIKNINH